MVDWAGLRVAASAAARQAYAPYSKLTVGAAGLTTDGRIVTGCNVENASFGLTICAEVALVADMRRVGAEQLTALSVVNGDGVALSPCGRCRQVLWEHGGAECLIDWDPEPLRLEDLLPHAFGRHQLPDSTR
jgi:cytidine deaminase